LDKENFLKDIASSNSESQNEEMGVLDKML
jgi:hypothetical protein